MTDEHPLPTSSEALPPTAPPPPVDEDSDPDFDDLDDVLDQFSASAAAQTAKAPLQPTPSASGPGRPNADVTNSTSSVPPPPSTSTSQVPTDPSEEEFMAHLNAEMSALISNISTDPAASDATPADLGAMGKELEAFTERMEKEGVKPEDLLRAILGEEAGADVVDAANKERHAIEREKDKSAPKAPAPAAAKSTSKTAKKAETASTTSFEDTIRRTMERMSTSDATATNAATQSSNSEEDMLAQLLRAMESEGGPGADGEDGDLSKMFMGMMEQLTNKEMLYEPMKELDTKFPEWLRKNKGKLSSEDSTRYENQRRIVGEIVGKFEEAGYSDEDSSCREFIWERMQKMQAEGSPPEDLIANPLPGMGGMPSLGALGGGGGDDAQCPTQ